MKQLEVTIMGQSYILACTEGGEVALLEAVNHVDREMCAIRDAGKVKARERIAVLAALNVAYELAQRPAAAAPAPRREEAPAGPTSTDVSQLIRRVDEALGQDGRLI
ncbi:cell division protein ZapA [Caldimonas brevitalea]|uniref:Cell division protein ZapA n=1 Tax=Caldimonas brevitalea TaxID=413882 RepID=A0A0G3BKM4_9BURK|nr:cell division protein ZapA [Caldimonas brevitalea]AKJ29937.1 cell division protein ZapA [Caldimonas brevitalea]